MSDSVAETARRVTTGQFTPISDQPVRPSRRLQAIIERTMSLDPNHRFRDMRALGQDLLQLAGQRTRITWGLTFGEVAAAARPHPLKDVDDEPIALARTRAPRRAGRTPLWPILAAACVGVASVTAFTWSTKPPPAETRAAPPAVPPAAPAAQGVVRRLQTAPPPPRQSLLPVFAQPEPRAAAPSTPAPSPQVAHSAAKASPPVSTETRPRTAAARKPPDGDVVAEENERVAAPVDEDDSRNRGARPRQRQRIEPRAAQPGPAAELPPPPEAPDWIVERRRQKAHSSQTRFQTGTNAAPIFD